MDLNDLDLTLLRVLHHLVIERGISTVAEIRGMSQPEVGSALKRRREALRDEHFLRTTRGMQATPLAEQFAEPVASAVLLARLDCPFPCLEYP